ncbi:MAG: hypothetical protein U1E83_10945 [Methylotetracoccus sp.]
MDTVHSQTHGDPTSLSERDTTDSDASPASAESVPTHGAALIEISIPDPAGPREDTLFVELELDVPEAPCGPASGVTVELIFGANTIELARIDRPGRPIALIPVPASHWPPRSALSLNLCTAVPVKLIRYEAHASRAAYLGTLQHRCDEACRTRDELFERGLLPLDGRGELLDKVRLTIAHLEELGGPPSLALASLRAFVADPYFKDRQPASILFDGAYLVSHWNELCEGRIQTALQDWHERLRTFHLAVIQLGNRAFLQRGAHKPHQRQDRAALLNRLEQLELEPAQLLRLKARNGFLNTLELLLRRDRLESVVPDLEIETSSYCNYSCVMCGHGWFPMQYNSLDDAHLNRLAPILPYVRHVTICGVGETTSAEALDDLSRMMSLFRCATRLFTNGSLIHRRLDALARMDKVCVSFDGASSETFQAQRRGSNFRRVVRNVGLLRQRAPNIELAFSVVVSRLNLHEIPGIVTIAAELGVDHVALSPVWHDSSIALRPSDRPVFDDLLREARSIAGLHDVVLQLNLGPEDFAVAADQPLDRAAILREFSALPVPSARLPELAELERRVVENRFGYHPPAMVFPDRRWPAPGRGAGTHEPRSIPGDPFDLESALERTERAINHALAELARRDRSSLSVPYCLSPWKYAYLHASGKHRLCPQTQIDVGHWVRDGLAATINDDRNRHFRRTMFGGPLEEICRRCLDPYRRTSHEEVAEHIRLLDLDPLPTDLSCYSPAHRPAGR